MKIHTKHLFAIVILAFMGCTRNNQTVTEQERETSYVHVSSDEGKEWNVFGVKITGKIMSAETDGEYSVIVTETPPQGGPPKHVHKHEDELFYVLKGKYKFFCGDQEIIATEGDFIRLSKGIPHHFVNVDTTTGITMNTITPGGLEQYFEDVANASKQGPLTRNQIDSLAKTYGVTFVKK